MKEAWLKKLAEKLKLLIAEQNISAKELSKRSGISYTTLNPILNGTQECGFTKLLQIAEALNIEPNELLEGLYVVKPGEAKVHSAARYHAVFISVVKVSYCILVDLSTNQKTNLVLQFPLRCGEHSNTFIEHIQSAIEKLALQMTKTIDSKDIAIFLSVLQYGRENNRRKIEAIGKRLFNNMIIESDALTDYRAFIGNKNGICISINDGDAITFSTDKGKDIQKLHGYGFPISDVAGNFWLGCEAIKHAIRVKENLEAASPLSDRLLALYNNDIYFLSTSTMENPETHYTQASSLVKELFHEQKQSYAIVEKSAQMLMDNIKIIDKKIGKALPICLSGELAHLYERFFLQKRLLKMTHSQSEILLQYGLDALSSLSDNHA